MKKLLFSAACLAILIFLVLAYMLIQNNQASQLAETEKISILQDLQYAERLSMASNVNTFSIEPAIMDGSSKYNEVIFCAEPPEEMADNVIYLYPDAQTQQILEKLNNYIEYGKINPAKYGLASPITMEDILTKPDQVTLLLLGEEPSIITTILSTQAS